MSYPSYIPKHYNRYLAAFETFNRVIIAKDHKHVKVILKRIKAVSRQDCLGCGEYNFS